MVHTFTEMVTGFDSKVDFLHDIAGYCIFSYFGGLFGHAQHD